MSYNLDELKARLPMLELCSREGVEFKRVGGWYVGLCPFHEERHGSFQVGSQRRDRAQCRGCGWAGDVVEFWMQKRGVDFKLAVEQLASLVGMAPEIEGVKWAEPKPKTKTKILRAPIAGEKPSLPKFRALRAEEIEQLAKLRGLSVEGVRIAAETFKRVGFCEWPQFELRQYPGVFKPSKEVFGSWVVTDDQRRVAQFRRLDGESYQIKDGEAIKAWTKGSPSWPIGAAELGSRRRVIFVEGGADMVAAYHFLQQFRMMKSVGVVCMLGSSNLIVEDALPYFKGCKIRIIADHDKVKEKTIKLAHGRTKIKRTQAGIDAALRWSKQLRNAGAVVKVFSLEGLKKMDGTEVSDVNDLALMDDEVFKTERIREAFTEWRRGFGD